jgi:hypothetical protein
VRRSEEYHTFSAMKYMLVPVFVLSDYECLCKINEYVESRLLERALTCFITRPPRECPMNMSGLLTSYSILSTCIYFLKFSHTARHISPRSHLHTKGENSHPFPLSPPTSTSINPSHAPQPPPCYLQAQASHYTQIPLSWLSEYLWGGSPVAITFEI